MATEDGIRRMVRSVVQRTLGLPQSTKRAAQRPLVTEADVQAVPAGGEFAIPEGALVTPLARQVAMDRHVTLVESKAPGMPRVIQPGIANPPTPSQRTIAIGADHAGFALKEALRAFLTELGYLVVDCGTGSANAVDYPDFAFAVAQLVGQGRAWRGIVVDGAGTGSCMAANKVPGVRAALCYDQSTAVNSREHNDANVLTLGAGMIGANLAKQIVQKWLETPFAGGRHAKRVEKIMGIEKRYSKGP